MCDDYLEFSPSVRAIQRFGGVGGLGGGVVYGETRPSNQVSFGKRHCRTYRGTFSQESFKFIILII